MKEFLLLTRIRRQQFRNGFELLARTGRLRLIAVVSILLLIWAGVFFGLYRSFLFLQSFLGVGEILIDRLIYLLALGLLMMLVFSNAVISFQLHYRGREATFLQTLPLPRSRIFWFLLAETLFLSTWAGFFLIFPAALAYGMTHDLPLSSYLAFPLFGFLLAALSSLLGTLIAALIPWFLISRRVKVITIFILLLAVLTYGFRKEFRLAKRDASNRQAHLVDDLLKHTRITIQPVLPSYWAAEGFLQFVRGRYSRAGGFLAVIFVNTLLVWQIVELTAGRGYYRTCLLYRSRGEGGRRRGKVSGRTPSDLIFGFLPPPGRAIVLKDLRLFIRDPSQWIQASVLFGLLTIYIINIRNMPRNIYQPFWKNLITFFNLGATSFVLATVTTRFVYPLLSLEGRTFWVLGLAPLRRATIFKIKFWTSLAATLVITETLMLLSNHILEVPRGMMVVTCGAVFMMTVVLVSLAMGLGAIFPDFKEDNPARIASGFGGTLNLILSLVYILLAIICLAVPFHLRIIGREAGLVPSPYPITFGIGAMAALSLLASYLPLKLGQRALQKTEF